MLAALNLGAVILGVAAGGLAASLLSLVLGFGLGLIGDWGPDVGLVIGVVVGLAVGGWLSGSHSRHSHRFHGSITGLVLAFIIVVVARLGGSPANTGSVLWLAFVAIVIGGVAGWLGGRRRAVAGRITNASPPGGRGRKAEESPDSTGQGAG